MSDRIKKAAEELVKSMRLIKTSCSDSTVKSIVELTQSGKLQLNNDQLQLLLTTVKQSIESGFSNSYRSVVASTEAVLKSVDQ